MICEKCGCNCDFYPARIDDYPWDIDYWICPECNSTYEIQCENSSHVK